MSKNKLRIIFSTNETLDEIPSRLLLEIYEDIGLFIDGYKDQIEFITFSDNLADVEFQELLFNNFIGDRILVYSFNEYPKYLSSKVPLDNVITVSGNPYQAIKSLFDHADLHIGFAGETILDWPSYTAFAKKSMIYRP